MSNLDKFKKAQGVDQPITSPEDFARRYGVPPGKIKDMIATIRSIDQHDNTSTEWIEKFMRVKMPKLWMPRSFVAHCESLAHVMEVRVDSIYQAIWLEAMYIYSTRIANIDEQHLSPTQPAGFNDDYLSPTDSQAEPVPSGTS